MSVNWHLLDKPNFVKRVIFVWVLSVFTWTLWWFFHFAETSLREGVEIAAIIGAVNAPVCYLLGSMMSIWKDVQVPPTNPPPTS